MRTVLVIASFAFLTGCTHTPAVRVAASRPPTAEESRIIEIARQAVAKNDTWVKRAEFHLPKRQADGSWIVTVCRLPYTPGGFRDIAIDVDGRITDYDRGY